MPILGRRGEQERIGALVRAVRGGRGGALVVVGEAGMGKTSLLADAVDAQPDLTVLVTRGRDGEQQLAFAALAGLVAPLRPALLAAEGTQGGALRAALAMGPPVAADRFAAYAGLLALLAAAATERPMLVVVDDAQWLDAPSAEALAFCMPRLADDPIAFLVAARTPPPAWLDGCDRLALGPLPDAAALALLEASGVPLAPTVPGQLVRMAGGNPLVLQELPRVLDDAQRAGTRPLEALPPGTVVAESFGRTLDGLPRATRAALDVLAVAPDVGPQTLSAALAADGLTRADLAPARAADVLDVAGTGFRHPVLRELVAGRMSAARRRAVHRALAGVLDPERDAAAYATHAAAAAVGPDEDVARALDRAAGEAMSRTAYAVAADLSARGARLSAHPAARAGRLLAAGHAAIAAGRPEEARALLEQALVAADDPVLRARVAHARSVAGILREPLDGVLDTLEREADRVAPHAPPLAAALFAEAVFTRMLAGQAGQAMSAARRALALGTHPVAPEVAAYVAGALVLVGRAREARRYLEVVEGGIHRLDPLSPVHTLAVVSSIVPLVWGGGDLGLAQRRVTAWIGRAREAGYAGFLGFVLGFAADIDLRRGRVAPAVAHATEGIRLSTETGQDVARAYALVVLARARAAQGDGDAVEAALADAEAIARRRDVGSVFVYATAARGLLALGEGRADAAVDLLAPMRDEVERRGLREPLVLMWEPDLIEALVRAGREREAREVLRRFARDAHTTGSAWARGATLRCRGLLDPAVDPHFAGAVALHREAGMALELARTQLLYGERLRRTRRRAEARTHLAAAADAFAAAGATAWAARARDELIATGARPEPARPRGPSLTPRELQVALVVADGLRNREVAARLFLSEKTVERHLSVVYAKLDVRSRAELVRRLSAADGGEPLGVGDAAAAPGAA